MTQILEWIGGRPPASDYAHSEPLAESWREASRTLPVTIEVPSSDGIWNAATLRGRFPIAYTGAFAAAPAQKYNCPLVAGDPELRRLDQLEVDWIGSMRSRRT